MKRSNVALKWSLHGQINPANVWSGPKCYSISLSVVLFMCVAGS